MTTVGVTMVRDEADVIEGTLRHMADEVDYLLVADNGSVDGTREILLRLQHDLPMRWLDDPDPAYYQSRKMTALADLAHRDYGADWIVPFDADELWLATGRLADVLASQPPDRTVCWATLLNHLPTGVDSGNPDPFRRIAWRAAEPGALPKCAVRWQSGAVIEQGNHGAQHPRGVVGVPALEVRHFPARSAEQWMRKGLNGAAAYARTDLPEDMGAHWRSYGRLVEQHGPGVLMDVYRRHWWHLSPTDSGLVYDPAPYMRWRSDAAEA